MATLVRDLRAVLRGDNQADRVVPNVGFTARLTLFSAAAMAFLAVFTLALSSSAGRLADVWGGELASSSTIRISAPPEQMAAQVERTKGILETTPGIASFRVLTADEERALLEPWLGTDVPLDQLPVPKLIDITEIPGSFDPDSLRLRLQGDVPGALLDDHARWREPLLSAARRMRNLAWTSLVLIAGATAAMITLAAQAALAANLQVIEVLRLIGARDHFIAGAFVRRFALRSLYGAAVGTAVAMIGVALIPRGESDGLLSTGFGFSGWQWLTPLLIPLGAALVAFLATRATAYRLLRSIP